MDTIIATYQTNYNGVILETLVGDRKHDLSDEFSECVESSEEFTNSIIADNCIDAIAEIMFDSCDDNGQFDDDEDVIASVLTEQVKKYFGEHINVTIEIDNFSS
jgi:nitrogen fixation-related uncharacterized protein